MPWLATLPCEVRSQLRVGGIDTTAQPSHGDNLMNDRMTASVPDPNANNPETFSEEERRVLITLRKSYAQGLDLLSRQEQARLRFLRWLIDTSRLQP